MSLRYDSIDHLQRYRDHRAYPAIHDPLFRLIFDTSTSSRYLDLCCGTGLLGQRLMDQAGSAFVLGVEASTNFQLARSHGVSIAVAQFVVGRETLAVLADVISRNEITALIARRCLPEILGGHPSLDVPLVEVLASSGIIEVFVQGRVVSNRSTNRLASVDAEIGVLSSRYRVTTKRGPCCRLILKETV